MNIYNESKFVSTFFGEMHPELELIGYTTIKKISPNAAKDENWISINWKKSLGGINMEQLLVCVICGEEVSENNEYCDICKFERELEM